MNGTGTAAVTPLRQPSREQKRQIMSLLEVSYDVEAGRYKATDTDATIAETIGGGCMSGWVAELREEFFGPDGGNGEMEVLLAAMREWLTARRAERTKVSDALAGLDAAIAQVEGFEARVVAIRKAVGPKAR